MTKKLKVKDKTKSLLLVLLVTYLIIFIYFLYHAYLRLNHLYDITAAEGINLGFAKLLSENKSIYSDIHKEPKYNINSYPPIFLVLMIFLFPLVGKTLLAGRIISFISSLLVGFINFKILTRKTKNKLVGFTFALAYFSTYYVFFWALSSRPDFISLLFSFTGIFFIQIFLEKYIRYKKKNLYYYLSVLFFILAFYSKQDFIAAPLATFLFLFIKHRKLSYQFLLHLIIFSLCIFLVINLLTNWQFFIHVFLYNISFWEFPIYFVYGFIITSLVFLVFSLNFLFSRPVSLLSLYFLTSLLIMVLHLPRSGIGSNIFLEPFAIMIILTGLIISDIKKTPIILMSIIFLLLQIPFTISGGNLGSSFLNNVNYINNGFIQNLELEKKISNYINNSDGNVLVEFPGYSIKNNFKTPLDVYKIYTLESIGIINKNELYEYCVQKNFSMIVSFGDLEIIKGIKNCINDKYTLVEIINMIFYPDLRFNIGPETQTKVKIYKLAIVQ